MSIEESTIFSMDEWKGDKPKTIHYREFVYDEIDGNPIDVAIGLLSSRKQELESNGWNDVSLELNCESDAFPHIEIMASRKERPNEVRSRVSKESESEEAEMVSREKMYLKLKEEFE